jgi:2-phospho-L-lactate guanylyltransferase (CobY/MobA/RfbA family)
VIQEFIKLSKKPPCVVIAPDRRKDGTNALLISPTGLIGYHYGQGSFKRHCELAYRAEAQVEVVERLELGLDLDLPDDLEYLRLLDTANPLFSR